jgi:sulfite exporter TauE/SafE
VGRLLTYLGLGATAGLVGTALDLAGDGAGIGRASAVVAGVLLVVWGLAAMAPSTPLVRIRRRAPRRAGALLGRVLVRIRALPSVPRAALLGLSTTFVPCGWLYAFVAASAASGSVDGALVVMAAFWLGTLPALLVASIGLGALTRRLGDRSRAVSASLVVVSGVLLLALRATAAPPPDAPATEPRPSHAAPCPLHAR